MFLQQRLSLHAIFVKRGLSPTVVFSNKLIDACSKRGFLSDARHLFDAMPVRNVFTWNAMIYAYVRNGDLIEARRLFDQAPMKDTVTYNSLISGYSNSEEGLEGLALFARMHVNGTGVDDFTVTSVMNIAAKLSALQCGRQVHGYLVKTGNDSSDCFTVSSLIDMYSKCGSFQDATRVFDEAGGQDSVSKNAMVAACCRVAKLELGLDIFWRHREMNDTVSWNTIIAGCVQNGCAEMGLDLFIQMGENGVGKNEHTFASVLSACSSLKHSFHGKEAHAFVLKNGLITNPFISSGLVDLYCKCDNLEYATTVYKEIGSENVFATTSMIMGHAGRGNMVEARKLFDQLRDKNSIAWTALFSGYVKVLQFEDIFELFREFTKKVNMGPDVVILIIVLGACAARAHLHLGKQVHCYIIRWGIEIEEKLGSAIIDMYAKCGHVKYSEDVFLRVTGRDRVTYNAMMSGFAHNGLEGKAIVLFEEMVDSGMRPDEITFIALLSACRHAGLVEVGEKYFVSMMDDYGIPPEIDHYSCMVDLLGRANRLEKAIEVIKGMPIEADGTIWGTFLNACRMNGNLEMAIEAEEKLFSIESKNGARYVQLANVYAAEGKWIEMGKIRRKMRGSEVKKTAGCSWVYVGNKVSIFISGDTSHSQTEAIYEILAFLTVEISDSDMDDWSAGR
ncbi:putative pentatricopeptide repeat-containing protein At3g18840 [Aristolochia californica]|uniref:putative pentatricopeptide repeat-containing protein At3g18840 n=1 Tax=Aristolochia californica TaxID=171875 RepID=UPI0035E1A6C6